MSGTGVLSLIREALADVRIVPCPVCNGTTYVGNAGMRVLCPNCRGSGVTTRSDDDA